MIFDKIQALLLANIDFVNNDVEAAFEACYTAGAEAQKAALQIEAVKGEANVDTAIEGVYGLSEVYGDVYASLSTAQREKLQSSVNNLITFADNAALESAVESLFDSLVRSISAAKALNALVDSLSAPNEG